MPIYPIDRHLQPEVPACLGPDCEGTSEPIDKTPVDTPDETVTVPVDTPKDTVTVPVDTVKTVEIRLDDPVDYDPLDPLDSSDGSGDGSDIIEIADIPRDPPPPPDPISVATPSGYVVTIETESLPDPPEETVVVEDVPIPPEIEAKYCRNIDFAEIPRLVTIPSGLVPFLLSSDNFDNPNYNLSSQWTGVSKAAYYVTNQIAYSCPNSLAIDFNQAERDSYVTRKLASNIKLRDNRPLILQLFLHYSSIDDVVTVGVYNQSGSIQGPLLEFTRMAYTQEDVIQVGQLSLRDVKALEKYQYVDPPIRSRRGSSGISYVSLSETMRLQSRGANSTPRYTPILGQPRTMLYETITIKHADYSNNVAVSEFTVLPYKTDARTQTKLYGWNGITLVLYSKKFDCYINGELVVANAPYYINHINSDLIDLYPSMLYFGSSYTLPGQAKVPPKGIVFVDNIDLYSLRPPDGRTVGDDESLSETSVPIIMENAPQRDPGEVVVTPVIIVPSEIEPSQATPSGLSYYSTVPSASYVYDQGCLVLSLNELTLHSDINGCFTYTNSTAVFNRYLHNPNVGSTSEGCLMAGNTMHLPRGLSYTNIYIGRDGCIEVGKSIDNRKDNIPFDYQYGEVALIAVLNTNDTRRTPVIDKIFFELG